MGLSTTFSEADLPTSSAEDRTQTFDAEPATPTGAIIPAPLSGDVLQNRFLLQECLARGAATRVFRAIDQRRQAAGDTDPWVVLKIVTTAPGQESRALITLRREAAISQGLEHPNLPWVRGLDQDGPHTFMCMAWLEGESLATILDNRGPRPMTRVQALHIVEGISRALTYLHRLGITHSDVKPGNILVNAEGHATLLDLGVALGPDNSDRVTAHGYTPQYASPEVLRGQLPTPADDLFSLACVAYRMLSGYRAFGEGNAREAATNGERPGRPENLPPSQWRALEQALAYAREARQRDVPLFLSQLKGARDDPAAATDPAADESRAAALPAAAGGQNLRRWWPVAALVASAVAIAVLILFRKPGMPTAPIPVTGIPRDNFQPAVASTVVAEDPAPAVLPAHPMPTGPVARPPLPDQPAPPRRQQPDFAPAQLAAATPAVERTAGQHPVRDAADNDIDTETEFSSAEPPAAGDLPATPGATAATAVSMPERALPDTATARPEAREHVPFSSLRIRRYVEASYPRSAAARRVAGWVDVVFTVDASGQTSDVRIVDADPPGVFDDAALAAVRRWRFAAEGSSAVTGPVHSGIRMRFNPE